MNNPQNYINHPLNNSPSKQSFKFTCSKRFISPRILNNRISYDLPSTRCKTSYSFATSSRKPISYKLLTPSPGDYECGSNSEGQLRHYPSIGKGREQVSFGSFLGSIKQKLKMPGPGHYQTVRKARKIGGIMKGKRVPKQPEETPGPGMYQLDAINLSKSGSYRLSTYTNHRIPKMHESVKVIRKQDFYSGKILTQRKAGDGQSRESQRNKNQKSNRILGGYFSRTVRKGIVEKVLEDSPGYKYRAFSELGGYS